MKFVKNQFSRNRPIKVAYVLTPIEFGGAERVSLLLLRNIDRLKYEIHIFALLRPWEKSNVFMRKIKGLDLKTTIIAVAKKPIQKGRDPFRIFHCVKVLFTKLALGKYDIIHTNGYFADIISIIPAKILRIPLLATCHGYINDGSKLDLYNKIDISALKYAKKIIVVSEEIKNKLCQKANLERKIKLINNAVEMVTDDNMNILRRSIRDQLSLSQKTLVIGYVGRLSKEKGVKYLIESGVLLSAAKIPYKILIIGDGPEKINLVNFAKHSGISENIVFLGFQEQPESYLPAFDLFVLPSLTEGTPMALLEAMSYGIPAIASDVGDVPKIIKQNVNGILVPTMKPKQIYEAIIKLYKNRELGLKFAERGKIFIHNKFNVKSWISKIENEYNEIVENGEKY